MAIKIALAGNPNCGKTTLFNALTGSNQFVGNWPGVTVEKKEGTLKGNPDVIIMDLPGIYSLSPYTLEEVVSRNYLLDDRPDAILNMVDGTNLERNLYLTTQLTELGIPVVIAINMMDVVRKNGDNIDTENLSKALGCAVTEISALKGEGIMEAVEMAIEASKSTKTIPKHYFSGSVEHAIAHIEEAVLHDFPEERQRWYAIKLFERDEKIIHKLAVVQDKLAHIEQDIVVCEHEMDDDSESIITTERYTYIDAIIHKCCERKNLGKLTTSDKIDKVVTNRFLALPIFAAIMFIVYFVSVTTVGSVVTDWAMNGVFGTGWHFLGIGSADYKQAVTDHMLSSLITPIPNPADYGLWITGIPVALDNFLTSVDCADWLQSLIVDGIAGGVGGVLGFVPQMLVLFFFLAFLEYCGYMSRIAFILDHIFSKFGLSGKSFIPILIGTGCGVPGIMASRTIENEQDRRMTIITTTFIPCGAKLPMIALIAGAIFHGAWWVAPSAYFAGITAIICSGVILKKTRMFVGEPSPFVMELPPYHMPTISALFHNMWERGWSFIKKAGSLIMLSCILIWFISRFGWNNGSFGIVSSDSLDGSILAIFGSLISWIFHPLGWGNWQMAVASVTGLFAKENIVSTLSVLYGIGEASGDSPLIWETLSLQFTTISAYSFLIFNLLCAPCIAAMDAIRREMKSWKWFWFAILYQTGFAYGVALCIYQFGSFIVSGSFGIGTCAATITMIVFLWFFLRKKNRSYSDKK